MQQSSSEGLEAQDERTLQSNPQQDQIDVERSKDEESDSAYEPQTCTLCYGPLRNSSLTPCGHLFCWDCIQMGIKVQLETKVDLRKPSVKCPQCREEFGPEKIILLLNY